jgi:hypothetical protein
LQVDLQYQQGAGGKTGLWKKKKICTLGRGRAAPGKLIIYEMK